MPAPSSPSVPPQELLLALVAEAAKKSRVCWLTWSGGSADDAAEDRRAPRLVWHAWYDGAVLVLSDDDQPLPGITTATTAEVVMRSKDTGGELVRWTGSVAVVEPTDGSWDEAAAALLGVRLNLPDPAAALAAWRSTATIVRIAPVGATGKPEAGPLP